MTGVLRKSEAGLGGRRQKPSSLQQIVETPVVLNALAETLQSPLRDMPAVEKIIARIARIGWRPDKHSRKIN